MLKLNTLLLCFISCLALQLTTCYSAENKAATKLYYDMGEHGGWVPFHTGAETGQKGLLVDIGDALQAMTGIEFITVHFPPKRAQKALIDGIVDFDFVCLEWLTDGQPGPLFVATDPLFEITEHLITLTNNTHLFPTRQSMFGKPVGTVAGYLYFDDNDFIRTDFLNENSLILGLKNQRFEVAILERETAKYWAKRNNTEIGFAAIHTTGQLVMRIRKEHKALLPLLNRSIKELKSTGKLQAILDSHGVDSKIY